MSDRYELLNSWLQSVIACSDYDIAPASSDASFRRYFRVSFNNQTLIVMDAPPEQEDCAKFIKVAKMMFSFGLNVPDIKAQDLQNGFLLLTDLGNRLYLSELNQQSMERLYGDAIGAMISLQAQGTNFDLPAYDHALLARELEIFREWYLCKHLNLKLSEQDNQKIDQLFTLLIESALAQPKVIVHRDFHSRNLLVVDQHNPGILDFQDAVIGPVTYDLVSLLKDCYIDWPVSWVQERAKAYYDLANQSGILSDINKSDFLRCFDLMGVQRHLKAVGIFARLKYRDNKSGYLQDIPRTLNYIRQLAHGIGDLKPILELIDSKSS